LGNKAAIPVAIGSHTSIGSDCHIEAAAIGSQCLIGNKVKLGKRVIIKDCCVIEDNVVLGDDTVVPPFTHLVAAENGLQYSHPNCRQLPPSIAVKRQEDSIQFYQDFVNRLNQ
jgi:carbonic anhydrase/acetyltransferase-like protein (isoleucine patch superfamily)